MSLVNSSQHGFIPGRPCTTQLLEVLHHIGSLLDSGKQTDVIFVDMSKAFDKVSHVAHINKLEQFHISGSLLQWFSSYLHGRQQRVTALGAISSQKLVCSGVPQGSILGPILFLLYAKDLPEAVINSTLACFADDTKIFRRVDSTQDASLLQTDLNNLDIWSNSSGLTFNELKCKSLCITWKSEPIACPYAIKGKELAKSFAETDLGIWITSDLTWSNACLTGVRAPTSFLASLSGVVEKYLTSRLEGPLSLAGSLRVWLLKLVWSPQSITLIHRAERVQRRATKFILNLPHLCSETYWERLISLLPISYWHEYLDQMFLYKAVYGLVDVAHDVLPELITQTRTTRSTANNLTGRRPALFNAPTLTAHLEHGYLYQAI